MKLAAILEKFQPHRSTHTVTIPPSWHQGRTSYGGLSSVLAYQAAKLSADDLPPLQSAQIAFVGPLAGDVEVTATVLRRGKNTAFVKSEISSEISGSIEALQRDDINCVILDMGVPDKQAYEILESVKRNGDLENIPVIVFTGKSLSMNEEMKIKKYADSIIVKTAHSYQRMLDEVSLFLHIVEDKKAGNKKENSKNQLDNVLKDKTVLVVDDDVRNIYSLTKALEVHQMKVITAIDGAEALKSLKEHPQTDVVLLDMMMPNLDGYETAQLIRENKKWKNLPVIAVTAKAMTGDREKCINAGASDYITKPVDVDQLLSLLRVWLYNS